MQSFFQDFKRDDGSPVTVEYHYEDGGSCVCIEKGIIYLTPSPFLGIFGA